MRMGALLFMLELWVELAMLGLATARLARLLVLEDGPYMAFHHLRKALGIRHDEYSNRIVDHQNPTIRLLGGVFNCTDCMSVWVALLLLVLYTFAQPVILWLIVPLALSMIAMMAIKLNG